MSERLTPDPIEAPKPKQTEPPKDYRMKLLEGDQKTLLDAIDHFIVNKKDQWVEYKKSNLDSSKLNDRFIRFYSHTDEHFDVMQLDGESVINATRLLYAITSERYPFFKTFSEDVEDNPALMAEALYNFHEALTDINEALDNKVQSRRIMDKKGKQWYMLQYYKMHQNELGGDQETGEIEI